jgi:hypothetical protein
LYFTTVRDPPWTTLTVNRQLELTTTTTNPNRRPQLPKTASGEIPTSPQSYRKKPHRILSTIERV